MLLCCSAFSFNHMELKKTLSNGRGDCVRNLHSSSGMSACASWLASAVLSTREASTPADGLQTSTTSVLVGRTTLREKILSGAWEG